MISNIREYFRTQIAAVDSDLKESPNAFYSGDIPETQIDNTYQITVNNYVNNERADYRQDEVSVQLNIFGHGYRNELERYDDLFCKAISIRDNILSLINLHSVDYIVDANAGSVDASPLDGDDNGFQITINFTLAIAYFTED